MDIKGLKKFADEFNSRFSEIRGESTKEEIIYIDMVKFTEETGELADQILGNFAIQRDEKKSKYSHDALANEFADCLTALAVLAHNTGVDIEKALDSKTDKVRKKLNF